MYHPTPEQAEADRRAAYEAGVPHGFVAPGDAYKGLPTIKLWVMSELVREVAQSGRGGATGGCMAGCSACRCASLRQFADMSPPRSPAL